tara:strand:- start:79 stop:285 length:207 start_codon:yes stop_codon:yes gene_type:complete
MKTHKLSLPSSKNILEQLENLKNTYWDNNGLPTKTASSYWKIWQDKSFFNINYDDKSYFLFKNSNIYD